MKPLYLLIFMFSLQSALAATVECRTSDHVITVRGSGSNITLSLNGESAPADGLFTNEEIDVIARLRSFGEMTLFAKIGKSAPENYTFINGKRFSVTCR